MARLRAAKSPKVATFQDALKSLDRLANRPARLAIDTDSIYIPPPKKTHRQEEGRETRAASRPKTIAVVQSDDIQLFWSMLSTSFFLVIPPRKLGLYGTARFLLKLPGFPFHLEAWALKLPVKMVPEIARRPTQALVLQFAA